MEFDTKLPSMPPLWENDRLHFFKYMTVSTAKIVLHNRTLRWSTSQVLNDPFDMRFKMSVDCDPDVLRSSVIENLWQVYSGTKAADPANIMGAMMTLLRSRNPSLTRDDLDTGVGPGIDDSYRSLLSVLARYQGHFDHHMSKMKILALTSKPDDVLMWTHYAGSHKGVVMRFRSIPELDSPYGMAKPMNYVGAPPPFYDMDDLVSIMSGTATTDSTKLVEKMVYTKSDRFAYENEWRISTGAGRNPDEPYEDVQFGAPELDGIIFGLAASDADVTSIREAAAPYESVEFMKTVRDDSSMTVSIVPA